MGINQDRLPDREPEFLAVDENDRLFEEYRDQAKQLLNKTHCFMCVSISEDGAVDYTVGSKSVSDYDVLALMLFVSRRAQSDFKKALVQHVRQRGGDIEVVMQRLRSRIDDLGDA